jgi:putative ABC transport system permease protein
VFFTYLRRELRRRKRQAVFISLGLALGVGLVITVTAASDGVRNSQAAVLHALYGVGTDLTVTQPAAQGSGSGSTSFGFRQQIKSLKNGATAAGTKININDLLNSQYGTLSSGSLATVSRQHGVTAAVGGLTLDDVTVTGTVPAIKGGGGFSSNFTTTSFTVDGVDPAHGALGPLSAGKLTAGRTLTPADARSDGALVDSGYAAQNKLAVGGKIDVGGTSFTIIGLVSVPQGGSPPDAYIPLARAQSIGKTAKSGLSGQVNTIYVSAASAADVPAVQKEISRVLPSATVTDSSDLANEITGSLSSTSSLANNLGKWLSVAVLVAAFLLASLLTMTAVARRVREFGTLKALGWRSRRIIGQVMGESMAIGVAGGALGIGLGYGSAILIDKLAPKLSATVGPSNAASVTGPGPAGGSVKSAIRALTTTTHTVSVTLTAPVTVGLILLAVMLAIAGGLIAGALGGWRAARLRPAAALARVD